MLIKKVLIVSHYYPPHIGGIEIVAMNRAKQLTIAGCLVTVITSKVSGQESDDSIIDGIRVIRIRALNFLEKWGVPFPIFSPNLIKVLYKAIKNTDIVHVHDAFYISSFFAALCGRWYKKPIILTQHVATVAHPNIFVRLIQKIVYVTSGNIIFHLSERILVLNDKVKNFLIKQGISVDKIILLPNGVDTNIFHSINEFEKQALRVRLGLDVNKKVVLFVGRFVPKKGFDKLLNAQDNDYQIVFAGGYVPTAPCLGAIFLGKLDQQALAKAYQCADVFVLPSEDEGFPLSIQEAMASGLPIITSADEGYKCYNFNEDRLCFIVNPTSASIRESIKSVIYDNHRMQLMSAYSREYAYNNFSWPIIVQKLIAIYDDLFQNKKTI